MPQNFQRLERVADLPKLIVDKREGDGEVRLPASWRGVDSFRRLDLFGDWLNALMWEYRQVGLEVGRELNACRPA